MLGSSDGSLGRVPLVHVAAWVDRESGCLFNIRRTVLSREAFKGLTKCSLPLFGRLSEIVQFNRDYHEVGREGLLRSALLEFEDGFSMAFSNDKSRSARAGEVSAVVVETDSPKQLHDCWKIRFPEKLPVVTKDPQGPMVPVSVRVISVSISEEVRIQVASDRPIKKRYEGRIFKLGQE